MTKPQEPDPDHPAGLEGWLDEEDSFFTIIDEIVEARFQDQPRSTGLEPLIPLDNALD
jgi:hypothetical protein